MDAGQIRNLIFTSGFTTNSVVTDISGRGVGLDAVGKEIKALRGQVNVSSVSGKGTRVAIELPLTVAVVEILLIEAEGIKFGLPLLSVEEVVSVAPEEIETLEHRLVIPLRDRTLAVVKLSEILGLPLGRNGSAKAAALKSSGRPVVVASSLERRVGFLIDRVLGEEKIFIKSVGKHLGKLRNVSGAALLDSGEVVVILDTAELVFSACAPAERRIA